jgi:threonine dehydratase
MKAEAAPAPTLDAVRRARERLAGRVRVTPVIALPMRELEPSWREGAEASFKLELLQVTGTFKARGALNTMLGLDDAQRARGVTAVSAGNHAIAVAFAAQSLGVSAKVVIIRKANPLRVELTRSYGAEVVLADNVGVAFEVVKKIEAEEGRYFVHPFEGPGPVTGTATLGLEWFEQAGAMDAVVIACGGGGLLAGVACAMKQLAPATRVYGVEPEGADSMSRSFETGQTVTLPAVTTIADSLGAPHSSPYTFGVARQYVTRMARVTDAQLRDAMRLTFRVLKLAVEPAAAAALAGVLGPLRGELEGARRIGILVCGSNIDARTFTTLLNPD